MELLPLIVDNYQVILVSYGYYRLVRSGINTYTTLDRIYKCTKYVKDKLVNTPKVDLDINLVDLDKGNILYLRSIEDDYMMISR